MKSPLFILLLILFSSPFVQAQKKYINRKVAQKNYNAYLLMQEQKYAEALSIFNEAISDDPEAFFIYQNRAICKLHLKDTVGAISDYTTNIKLEPDNAESKYALGNIYKRQNDSVNAVHYFVPAIKQANEEFSQKKLLYMNNFVGHYFRLHEDFDSALVFYEQVKKYIPNNSSVHINAAVCYFNLDSIQLFCDNLEQAFVLGGDVNCIALKSYCKGCTHLLEARGRTDTLSRALDTRLAGIIPDTIYYQAKYNGPNQKVLVNTSSKMVKVYYNKLWQICLPEEATYYREAFWAGHRNFYGGEFTDYYLNGAIYARGRIENGNLNRKYKCYFQNGKVKMNGQFTMGKPTGKWVYYLEDGTPDYEVNFMLDDFKINILNKANPNYVMNTGSGKFNFVLDKWEKIDFVFAGEYLNHKREGSWTYKQGGAKIITEKYKKGKFKSGYVNTSHGNISSVSTRFDALIFIPPQLTQVAGLYFSSIDAAKHHSFIKTFGL